MSMDEVLEKSISQINFDDNEEEGTLPRHIYRYTLYWEHLYFNHDGNQLIGCSGMYRRKTIIHTKPMTFGDSKNIIERPGYLYCCKASQCRFVRMTCNVDIVPLYNIKRLIIIALSLCTFFTNNNLWCSYK